MFSNEDDDENDTNYIFYNSLISIKLVSENMLPHHKDFYMLRMENLDQSLILKRCETPLLQYSDLKESLFYIRNIDECLNIFGNKGGNSSANKRQNLKEYVFKSNVKINFNQNFLLQHMISKKFISIEKIQGTDNYMLKLVTEVEKAIAFPFSFKRINSSYEFLTYKNIVYISIYNKEKGQNYYINHNNIELEELADEERKIYNNGEEKKNPNNLINYEDLCVINYNFDKFYIINQNWYINNKENLYNGQLVNIIFTGDKNKENDKMMLSAEGIKVENKIEEVIGIKEEVREDIDGLMRDNNQKYIQFNGITDRIKDKVNLFSSITVKGIPFMDNLYEHVINNSFWVIEKKTIKQDELNTKPIEISDLVRIKNPLLGLYLIVKKKNKDTKYSMDISDSNILRNSASGVINNTNINNNSNLNDNNINNNKIVNNNINNNNNINTSSIINNESTEELEFELVNEEVLEKQYFNYNFKFFHYNVNEEKKLSANGKYVLKSVLISDNIETNKNVNKKNRFGIQDDRSYFEPLSLSVINDSDIINIKIEDDYILDITKVDSAKGNEVIFLQNIIIDLDYILKNYKKKKASANNVIKKITENINFFMEYLLNIEYMFKNENFEINRPVEERQQLLYKFNIIHTILEIINYFFPIVKDINSRDFSILDKKNDTRDRRQNYKKNKARKNILSSKSLIKENSQLMDEDSKISNIKSMLKLLLKFLLYLSKNNEDIKQDIFKILTPILEFSEYIFINDKSDLLNFLFEFLNDSETLQEFILSKKFKQSKIPYNQPTDGIFYIDKILSYIETNCNYLFYYKKLMHLNKIRYREEEIKEKIKIHINKVENDFRLNKYANNYKGKIYLVIKNITNLVNGQIKEWNRYIEDKEKKDNKLDEKVSSDLDSDENTNINKILKRNTGTIEMNSIKGSRNSKRNYYNDDLISPTRFEEDKNDADSNDNLNPRSLFSPQGKKRSTFFNAQVKNNDLNDSKNFDKKSKSNDIDLTKNNNNNNNKILDSDTLINNYNNNKNATNELANLAKNKIRILNLILDFLDYFNTINFDKILFRKEDLFVNMLKSDIKDDILENNLNFIINGNVCFIKFINELDFSTETTIGSILPYYIYNTFFANDSKKYSDTENENEYSNNNIEIIGSQINDDENTEMKNKESDNSEESEEEEKEDDNISNENLEEDNGIGNIGNFISKNEIKEEDKNLNSDQDNEDGDKNLNKKESIFLGQDKKNEKKLSKSRRFKSYGNLNFFKKKEKNSLEEEKDKDLDMNINSIIGNQIIEESSKRKRKKHKTMNQHENYERNVTNLLKEEAKKNEVLRFMEKCKEDNQKINKYLYILYSIYIFCANEYIEINYKFFKCLINYFINYERFCKLNFLKISLNDIKKNIMNKIVFINKNSFMSIIFEKIKLSPTLLNDNFDLQNFIDYSDNYFEEIDKDNEDKKIINKIEITGMNNIQKLFENDNWFSKIKKLSNEEKILIDFLIYYCKMNDQINYFIEKIECFKNIQKIICSTPNNNKNNNNNNDNGIGKKVEDIKNIFDEEKTKIMRQLISNKFNVLSLYGKLNVIKNKFLNLHISTMRNNLLEDYGIFKQADFLLWLLDQYEIDRYFNKIIYLEINQNVTQDKNSFDKLMNIKELFEIIESEIHKAKEESDKGNIKELTDDNENHYKIICSKLMTMTKKVLLNIFSGKELKKEKVMQMLIKENENFFAKIGFLNTLKIMIESIELYDLQYNIENNKKNENNYILKLNYCKEILRAFLEIQSAFPKFNNLVMENLDMFKKMVISSLKSIKDFKGNDPKKTLEEEKAFLCICYYASEILLFLLNFSKNTFTDIHGFVLEIFNILKNIYDCFHSPKNMVTYQLFYNYLIIKITLLLNKTKNTDSYSLEYFFRTIYDIKQMKTRILTCIGQLQSKKENSTGEYDYIEENESSEINLNRSKKNEEEEFAHWKDKLDKLYEFRVKKSINSGESKSVNSNIDKNRIDTNNQNNGLIMNIKTHEGFGMTENDKKEIMWESDDEREKLMFFLYFTSIYIIYIKDKNTGMDDNENNLDEEEREDLEFNFNSFRRKINNLLDSQKNMDDSYIDNPSVIKKKRRHSFGSQTIKSSIYTKKTKFTKNYKFRIEENASTVNNNTMYNNNYLFDNERRKKEFNASNISKINFPKCENRFSFELILLETIAEYKYHVRHKIIEIPVKNIENKDEEEDDDDYSNTESGKNSEKKEEEEKKNEEKKKEEKEKEEVKQNDAKIKFYYYEPNGIDFLLLEKIFKDIEIKNNLRYYCTNSYTNEEYEPLPSSKLMVVLFELQKKLESINPQQKKEYKLLYEHFIKNDMQKFMKYLLNTFNKDDFENIDLMANFSFNRFNEIYPYDSLYSSNESEKILSLVETLKKYEFELENEYFNQLLKPNKRTTDISILNLYNSDLVQFLNSLIYLYPHYDKKICLIFFRTGFMLLYVNCIKNDLDLMYKQSTREDRRTNSTNSELNLSSILNAIILLFSRKINHSLIETKKLFFLVLVSINTFLRKIKDNHIFVSQNRELIQDFFHKLDFILKHLTDDFEQVVIFMISTKSQQKNNKYIKIEQSLNYLINFLTTLIGFKKIDKEILTEEIIMFVQDIIEKIIKLIDLLLEQNKKSSFQTIDLLLNFIYYFVEGPDIENFKTLFNKGYYDLISHSINTIDYYNLFFSNINKENLNEILDDKIEQEYRIIKILFVYYCLCHHEYKDTDEFIKIRHWYKENFKNIKQKLKKIYYLSKKEMENREYEIDKMLLFLKDDDSYSEAELRERSGLYKYDSNKDKEEGKKKEKKEEEKEEEKREENQENKNQKMYKNSEQKNDNIEKLGDYFNVNTKIKRNNRYSKDYLIKFDLILIYYTLYNYYQDSFNDEFLTVPPKKSIVQILIDFLISCFNYIKYMILCVFYITYYIYKACTKKDKSNIELLQELSDIDIKSQTLDEKEMFKFLTSKIKYIEISLDYRLFKIYYPLLNKSKQIQDNKDYYLTVDNNQLSNYVISILNSYDKIFLMATQHYKIQKLFDLPALSIIFKNDNLYSLFLLILGIIANLIIGLSYSTFTTNSCSESFKTNDSIRMNCPHFLYQEEAEYEAVLFMLRYFGILMLILRLILITKYIIQTFAETIALYKNSYYKEVLSDKKKNTTFSYIIGFIPSFLKMFTNFQTIYYILSLFFILLGMLVHPFFYCFVLFELVKRVEVMQIILKAMYVPLGNIVTTLILCIILEYIFAVIALTIYQSHFPIIKDTRNMLRTFIRMFDQTFKKDGGVGTYLDITREPGYTPFNARYYAGTRFFFDLIFFLLINMIAFQVFFMIIIDYFSQSKEKTEEFTELSETKCLICELEREDLEKIYSNSKSAFELHINHAHSLIDYISYLVYLQTLSFKDPIIESRIWKLHLSNNLNYLPKGVCFKQKEKEMLEYLKK